MMDGSGLNDRRLLVVSADPILGTMARAMSVSFSSLSTDRSSPCSLFNEYSFKMVLTLSSRVCKSIMTEGNM